MRNSQLTILVLALLISLTGIFSIYSSTYQREGIFWQTVYQRQIAWVVFGLILFFLVSRFNYRRFWDATYILYGAVVFLLLLVCVLGATRLGAQRWLSFGGFNFQPSEIAKLVMLIFLARYFSSKSSNDISLNVRRMGVYRAMILPLIFVGLPAGLVVEQPDLGSGAMIMVVFFVMLYISGVKLRYLLGFGLLICLSLPVFWHFLRDYQRDRLMVFLNPNIDPLGAGYTVIQSKIAIGSGIFFGKGWLSGTQSSLRFLPESHTDFIFATFSEQCGFLGSILLLLLYYALIRQGVLIAVRTKDNFGRLLAIGISLFIGLQVFVNISMNMGLAPVVGVPLPLMSYGGSSICVSYIALGILANIDRTRSVF